MRPLRGASGPSRPLGADREYADESPVRAGSLVRKEPDLEPPSGPSDLTPPQTPPSTPEAPPVSTSTGDSGSAAAASGPFVFALGQVVSRFPSLAVERELAEAISRGDTEGLTDHQALRQVLSDRTNRYLARQMCWLFVIEGIETYLLVPRDPADLDLLIETVRGDPDRNDVDVVVGVLGPVAPPETCGGLGLPIVALDQVYSFDRATLIENIPLPDDVTADKEEQFRATAGELFDRIMQLAHNAGATDQHRALNYLAVRYPSIYGQTARAHRNNQSLSAVDVKPSRLTGVRRIVDVIFAYTHRETDVTEKYFTRVDVTEEFPFLVTKLSPYYER
jgi:PatG C-terminal